MPVEKIRDMWAFATPIRVIARPERLIIQDHRPTMLMLLATAGFVAFIAIGTSMLLSMDAGTDNIGLVVVAIFAVVCLVGATRGTLREVYVFDREAGTYTFVRRFIHRKEVIEGALSQFTGARLETTPTDDGDTYSVVLRQDGMFLTGVSEQRLRAETPLLNSFSNEADIANAIDDFLHRTRG